MYLPASFRQDDLGELHRQIRAMPFALLTSAGTDGVQASHLPLLLEFFAPRPQAEARDWLHHVGHIAGMLAARAAERELPHAVLLEILVEAGDGKVNLALLRQRASEEARDDTREAMDRLWEEEAVRFGSDAPAQDCAPPRRSPARPSHPEVQP